VPPILVIPIHGFSSIHRNSSAAHGPVTEYALFAYKWVHGITLMSGHRCCMTIWSIQLDLIVSCIQIWSVVSEAFDVTRMRWSFAVAPHPLSMHMDGGHCLHRCRWTGDQRRWLRLTGFQFALAWDSSLGTYSFVTCSLFLEVTTSTAFSSASAACVATFVDFD